MLQVIVCIALAVLDIALFAVLYAYAIKNASEEQDNEKH